jgi:hypothetical protein
VGIALFFLLKATLIDRWLLQIAAAVDPRFKFKKVVAYDPAVESQSFLN